MISNTFHCIEKGKGKEEKDAKGRCVTMTAAEDQIVIVMRTLNQTPCPEADPALTQRGKTAARQAISLLQSAIGIEATKNLRIFSSPFLRTLQTAEELHAAGVGIGLATGIQVDNSLCEVFGPIRIQPVKPNVVREGAVGQLPFWGKTLRAAEERFAGSIVAIANRVAYQQPSESPLDKKHGRHHHRGNVLLVTHGDALSAAMRLFYPHIYAVQLLKERGEALKIFLAFTAVPVPPRSSCIELATYFFSSA